MQRVRKERRKHYGPRAASEVQEPDDHEHEEELSHRERATIEFLRLLHLEALNALRGGSIDGGVRFQHYRANALSGWKPCACRMNLYWQIPNL